ncbi:MAG: DMT family transporter [Atopobiaceae bacterium]|jgi:drug/metabolite transporter (DMT)-like permease|nr:DMT family transporter [Atopobiaceae bacterium]MCH4181152.1 DMT family transporter [Atopobiaceae bacterium]MCH4214810.1 DMT family transporter [Atopobiaceae bacterium]MCH4230230.1 DMT family transporter [Atopobiaceae bacterium]MCH4276802.1 DMT family transporter [Atopobiaceae bacterium]
MRDERAQQGIASVEVFLGGASYGVMATSYKLSYAAGFTWNQVVASQAWFAAAFFAIAVVVGHAFGHRWSRLGTKMTLELVGVGALTCVTSILYCYAMSLLPVPVAITLLFQFTWIGIPIQVVITHRRPTVFEVASAAVILVGTVFASGIYQTGLAGYDPRGIACALLAAVSCAMFVTLSGRVRPDCSDEQRGLIVCLGTGLMSLLVCPLYFTSGVLVQGILPYAVVVGLFGVFLPVLLYGLGTPHLLPARSTVLASAELPAGLLISMVVLGQPIGAVQWVGVVVILAGVVVAQLPTLKGTAEKGSA